jgi:predicted amidohydrolase
MKERSAEYRTALCGSLIICENGQFFNRLLFVEPSGKVHIYNKRHLFKMGNENLNFVRGSERIIVDYKGWRICPMICYDLRFPVWARNRKDYDILVYTANWPQARNEVWNTLLRARAIENQAYVVGANRVGVDGNHISYSGSSQLINPRGVLLSEIGNHQKGIVSAGFSYSELIKFRTEFPALNDVDEFHLG